MFNATGKKSLLISSVATAMFCSTSAYAAVTVTTNMNGADAEVREDSGDLNINVDPLWGPIGTPKGNNRGTNTELATRVLDNTAGTGNNTSAMYLKFDISDANGVTNALLGLQNRVKLQLTTRNSAQQRWNRIHARKPYYGTLPADDTNPDFVAFASDPANYGRVQFNVYGLTNFAHPRYNWSESGVAATYNPGLHANYGPDGSITWYNAPGITPDSRTTGTQNQGQFNFNSDMQLLGKATLEDPGLPDPVPDFVGDYPPVNGSGSAAHCVGCTSFDFKDSAGLLHDLIEAARLAGQTHITLAVAIANDPFRNATGETAQVTPNDMLAFNYLFNPKEMDPPAAAGNPAGLQLNDDPSYNTDWTDLDMMGGADNGLTGPGPHTQILPHPVTGVPTRYGAQNDNGRFSPRLVFFIPEPTSFVLMVIGAMSMLATRRCRK